MKKICFIILFLGVANIVFGQSQKGPIIGYDKLEWGATIELFQRTYPTARELISERKAIGVREFEQTNVGSGISIKRFYFYNNKFYMATVMYEELDDNSVRALGERIEEIYGRFDDADEQTFPSGNNTVRMIRLVRYYRNNLHVTIGSNDVYNQFNRIIGSVVMIGYVNPIIRDEVDAAERRQRKNELGF